MVEEAGRQLGSVAEARGIALALALSTMSSAVQSLGRLPLDGEVEVIGDGGIVVTVVAFAEAVALLL